MGDLVKIAVGLSAYLLIGPLLGVMMARASWLQRAVFVLAIFLIAIPADYTTFYVHSIETYRGHTKGFQVTVYDMLLIALLVALYLRDPKRFRFVPPGLLLYVLFCLLCTVSIVNSVNQLYTIMSLYQFLKAPLIYVVAYNFLEEEKDLDTVLTAFALSLIMQALVGLKMRYLDGYYQIRGWFDHQNSMAMWTYNLALPLLAVALSNRCKPWRSLFYLSAFGAGGVLIILSLSRASLAVFAVGSALILGGSLLAGLTWKRIGVAALATVGGIAAISMAADTIFERFTGARDYDAPKYDFRWALNQVSKEMFQDTIIGVGWNNFNLANSQPQPKYWKIYQRWDKMRGGAPEEGHYRANACTESLYWLILAENGVPGMLGFILFTGLTFWWILRNVRRYHLSIFGFFQYGLLITLMMTYLHSQLERVLFQTAPLYTWLCYLAMSAKLARDKVMKEVYVENSRHRNLLVNLLNAGATLLGGSRTAAAKSSSGT